MLYWVPHCSIVFLKSSRPSLLIKRAALGNLKASFHCTHWHRFFPLKKVFFYLSVSPARKDFFSKTYPSFLTIKEGVLLKSSRPSLPLKKAPPLTPSPLSSGAREKTALLGARNRYAIRLADHQRPSPCYAGWDRQRNTSIYMEESCIQFSFYIIAIP